MTTESEESAPAPAREMSRSEKIFVRISIWQTVLSLVGVFIGVVALYAALSESEAVRRQTSAAVWPYVQLSMSDFADEETGLFELSLSNAGVGPADIRAMRVTFNGEPQTSWRDIVRAVGGDELAEFAQNAANNRVLRPGDALTIFRTTDLRLVAPLRSAVAAPSNAIEYCYCSIFEECWVADSRDLNARPETVVQCPDYGRSNFQN
jgi:hypothetical protein